MDKPETRQHISAVRVIVLVIGAIVLCPVLVFSVFYSTDFDFERIGRETEWYLRYPGSVYIHTWRYRAGSSGWGTKTYLRWTPDDPETVAYCYRVALSQDLIELFPAANLTVDERGTCYGGGDFNAVIDWRRNGSFTVCSILRYLPREGTIIQYKYRMFSPG